MSIMKKINTWNSFIKAVLTEERGDEGCKFTSR